MIKFNTGCDLIHNRHCKSDRKRHVIESSEYHKKIAKFKSHRNSVKISYVEKGDQDEGGDYFFDNYFGDFVAVPRPRDFPKPPKKWFLRGDTTMVKVTKRRRGFLHANYRIEINDKDGQNRLFLRLNGQKQLWIQIHVCGLRASVKMSADCFERVITYVEPKRKMLIGYGPLQKHVLRIPMKNKRGKSDGGCVLWSVGSKRKESTDGSGEHDPEPEKEETETEPEKEDSRLQEDGISTNGISAKNVPDVGKETSKEHQRNKLDKKPETRAFGDVIIPPSQERKQ
ncbi:hypothetical protein Ddc_14205 [Ditylenchus destructor]|nr:hypothetical protein Ddc_14205 [Ditylenchus destructor]